MKVISIDFSAELERLKPYLVNGEFTNITRSEMNESSLRDSDLVLFNPIDNVSLKDFYLSFRKYNSTKPLIMKQNFRSKLVDIISADKKTIFYSDPGEIDEFLECLKDDNDNIDYHPIPLQILMVLDISLVDIFLKISNDKFIKIVRKNENEIKEVLEKYKKKNCHYIYVKEQDFSIILDHFSQDEFKLDVSKIPEDLKKTFHKDVFHFVHYSLHMIGLNEETFKTTNRLLKNTIHVVKNSKKENLKKIWKSYCKNKNYLVEHSLILSHIVTSAAKFYGTGQSLADKLLMAAMFHDIALINDNIAKTYGSSQQQDSYNYKELEDFEDHHDTATKLLDAMNGVPSDVIVIINQHHEKFDGTGFPRGLAGKNINVSAVMFIVAHEFVQELYLRGFSLSARNQVLKEMGDKYTSGYFNQAVMALRKSFEEEESLDHSRMVS